MRLFSIEDYQKTALPLVVNLSSSRPIHDPPHMHDCREFVLVREGCGWCSVNRKRYPIIRGDLYMMDSLDVHEFFIEKRLSLYNIMFKEEFYSEEEQLCFNLLFQIHGKYTFLPHVYERLFLILNEIEKELKKNTSESLIYAKSLFLCFLITVCRNIKLTYKIESSDKDNEVSRMLDFISKHFCENIHLSDLAGVHGGTPEYVGRRFKELTGMTFSGYLKNYRISYARYMLESTKLTVSEIAYKLGWFDLAHFDRDFRKILGMPPAAYRKFVLMPPNVQ